MDTAPHTCIRKNKKQDNAPIPANLFNLLAYFSMSSVSNKQRGVEDTPFEKPKGLKPIVRQWHASRNGSCPCNSGLKFKKCCIGHTQSV